MILDMCKWYPQLCFGQPQVTRDPNQVWEMHLTHASNRGGGFEKMNLGLTCVVWGWFEVV